MTIKKHEDTVGALLWLPDGKRFVSGGMDAKVHFWVRPLVSPRS